MSAFLTTTAQEGFHPLNNDINSILMPSLHKLDKPFHTSVKPYNVREVQSMVNVDSLTAAAYYFKASPASILIRKLRRESLVKIDSGDFHVTIDPLINFELGHDNVRDTNTHINGRGFLIQGNIGKKFSFATSFYENQGIFVSYIDSFIRTNNNIPGQGFRRDFMRGPVLSGYDYNMASAYISYTPHKYFNFQLGHDKNFIGDGYRSLLISDNAFNYPFFKITTTIWKIKYVNLWAQFIDFNKGVFQGAGQHYPRKYGSFHYLSYNATKRLSIGLFEAIISEADDTLGHRGLDLNYLNPVIFYRPVEFSLGSPDNVLLGLNLKYKINNSNSLYGQIILDEFKLSEIKKDSGWYANKYGFQLGLNAFNLFKVKNLSFQSEINIVRPFTYSEAVPILNYGHYNQPIAHPLGSNFIESVSFLRYRYKSFYGVVKFLYAVHGVDTAGKNFGNNIYVSYLKRDHEYLNSMYQGLKKTLIFNDFRIGYIVNPKTNLNIEVGMSNRSEKDVHYTRQTNFIFVGIRTSISNFYYDF